ERSPGIEYTADQGSDAYPKDNPPGMPHQGKSQYKSHSHGYDGCIAHLPGGDQSSCRSTFKTDTRIGISSFLEIKIVVGKIGCYLNEKCAQQSYKGDQPVKNLVAHSNSCRNHYRYKGSGQGLGTRGINPDTKGGFL